MSDEMFSCPPFMRDSIRLVWAFLTDRISRVAWLGYTKSTGNVPSMRIERIGGGLVSCAGPRAAGLDVYVCVCLERRHNSGCGDDGFARDRLDCTYEDFDVADLLSLHAYL